MLSQTLSENLDQPALRVESPTSALVYAFPSPNTAKHKPSTSVVEYGRPAVRERYKSSTELPRGAQKQLIDAARFSHHIKAPVNTLITINAAHLQKINAGSTFELGHLWDGFQDLLERLRHWCLNRGMVWSCFWVREWSKDREEHWHIGLHLTARNRQYLPDQIAIWTDEPTGPGTDLKPHDVAVSEFGSWHITGTKRGGTALKLAAYLGKAEPNRIVLHGKIKSNPQKEIARYAGGEGPIEGKRYGISKTLGITAQRQAG